MVAGEHRRHRQILAITSRLSFHSRLRTRIYETGAPDLSNRSTLRRGWQRGRSSLGASEPVIKFDRRPFEHPLLLPRRASALGRDARPGARWIEFTSSKGFTPAAP
jgi:hypothetical protein